MARAQIYHAFLLLTLVHAQQLSFEDVTKAVGLVQEEGKFKWGGPCVADLNGDGIYDLILTFHASSPAVIFFGQPNGTFVQSPFTDRGDNHGVSVALRKTNSRQRLLSVNKGGGRGNNLRPPSMFLFQQDRKYRNVTHKLGLGARVNRGRVTMFMDLSLEDAATRRKKRKGPDVLVVGFSLPPGAIPQHAYENNRGLYKVRTPIGFKNESEGRAALADLDGDGRPELISFPGFQVYKLVAPFRFRDITSDLLGSQKDQYTPRTVAAVAELDFNNKGKFDLYLARSLLSDLTVFTDPDAPSSDALLKQTPRGLVDVSSTAGLPKNTRSMGLTTGDFDNNGYIDVFVTVWEGKDYFLMNNGNETFERVDSVIPKDAGVPGGHAVAMDYDQDGRVDVIVGQGGEKDIGGPYRIMRNVLPKTVQRNYLLVRVGTHPGRVATSLHAIVIVRVGGMKMMRRVGSAGTQGGGPSYLDTVHFGLGSFDSVDLVRVKWVAGKSAVRRSVDANQKITFGRV